jgi:hypothetical protein
MSPLGPLRRFAAARQDVCNRSNAIAVAPAETGDINGPEGA